MDASLLLLGASLHFKEPEPNEHVRDYNALNPGVGLMVHESRFYAAGGCYYNSIEKPSAFASVGADFDFKAEHIAPIGFTIGLGYVSGYPNQAFVPMVGGYYQINDDINIHAQALDSGVAFFLEYKL
jgi:hypothetical protein